MQTWDELVKAIGAGRRDQRQADGTLYSEIWRYLDQPQYEEVETMEEVVPPDGRKKGRKLWHGACAFAFYARDGQLIVRAGDDEAKPEEIFPGIEVASRRMAELMCDQKERAFRASLKAA